MCKTWNMCKTDPNLMPSWSLPTKSHTRLLRVREKNFKMRHRCVTILMARSINPWSILKLNSIPVILLITSTWRNKFKTENVPSSLTSNCVSSPSVRRSADRAKCTFKICLFLRRINCSVNLTLISRKFVIIFERTNSLSSPPRWTQIMEAVSNLWRRVNLMRAWRSKGRSSKRALITFDKRDHGIQISNLRA